MKALDLKTVFSNKQRRKDHIIKNMLYMIELNPGNVAKSRRIFGNNANIVCANALKTKWLDKFKKIQGFDIIMGNPPYNSGNTGRSGTSGVDNKFIDTFLDFLNKNGFLVFVTKTGWRSRFGGGSSGSDDNGCGGATRTRFENRTQDNQDIKVVVDRALEEEEQEEEDNCVVDSTLLDDEDEEDEYWKLYITKIEIHTPDSLNQRNEAMNRLADNFGIELYDGWDVERLS